MKYLKNFRLFELVTGHALDYGVGDTVICVDDTNRQPQQGKQLLRNNPLVKGGKYEILKIYTIPEDKFLGNPYARVEVKNLETGEISKGWSTIKFKLDIEADAEKYSL